MKKQITAVMAAFLSAAMAFNSLAATKLATPTGVQWSSEEEALPQWNAVDGAAGQYKVEAYRDDKRIYNSTHHYSMTTLQQIYEANGFTSYVEESGIYKFRVMALGDDVNTLDSDWSDYSEDWNLIKANIQFNAPTNAHWEGTYVCWDEPEIPAEYAPYLKAYEVSIFADGKEVVTHNGVYPDFDTAEWMEEEDVKEWTFSVRAISNTPSKIFHSEMAYSDGYDAEGENAAVSDTIGSILDSENPDDLLSAPEKLSQSIGELQVAMQTDDAVLEQVKTLEEEYAQAKGVTLSKNAVAEDVAEMGFNGEDVTIIGARLNAAEDNATVTLNIKKPAKEEMIDATAYKNAIQLDFHLEGIADGPLKVPVRITVPIPESINPEFFCVLHYLENGKVEEFLYPDMEIDEANRTASFTVTSFSTFVLAEEGIDYAKVQTPSNAEEFKALADALPKADDLNDEDYEAIGLSVAKLGEALIEGDAKAGDIDEELLVKLDALFGEYYPVEVSYEGADFDVIGLHLLAYVCGKGKAIETAFLADEIEVATSSNAAEKASFHLSALILTKDGKEIELDGSLKTPLLIYMDAPEGYDEIADENDSIVMPGGSKKDLTYEDGMFRFYTKRLGDFSIRGSKSQPSRPSSSSGGGAKAATVKPPKDPAGGSWKLVNGSYSYLYSDGTKAVNCWLEIGGQWYYFNMQGTMATGWLKDGGNYFYLDPATGSMVTGWQQIDGKWYYFNERSDGFKGMMYADTITPDGYEVDGSGAWVQ